MSRLAITCVVCAHLLWPSTLAQAQPGEPEAISLLGKPLYRLPLGDQRRASLEKNLAEAREALEAHPDDPDALIWLGRRTAYLGRYREAIEIFTRGVERFPSDPRFLRHRGHRYLTIRRLDAAIADLSRAAELIEGRPDEVEPDGIPNARNQPRSTTHTNIWYHLGLGHYLKGDFEAAAESYRNCTAASRNDDMLTASSYWLYMALRRLGKNEEAQAVLKQIHPEMDIIENHTYYDLLQVFKGEIKAAELIDPDADALTSATAGYGVGNWHLINGRAEEAQRVFKQVLKGEQWAAFGYIAAEAEMTRLKKE